MMEREGASRVFIVSLANRISRVFIVSLANRISRVFIVSLANRIGGIDGLGGGKQGFYN
jgi:hypothetical protein